ncbi:MAG: CBS domain-containing protein [Candidatus Thermoplasmatota archaeon]|nr:CBS domain-containing protein [Candidatus Thermoplasmatota archaeon]MCL5990459.1 CBS domain-containing protein [Candidatus Thermoplasmatota archaeon]
MPKKVKEIMTKDPITHKIPSNVSDIIKILIKENITGLPLVNSSGKYAGMISRRDVFDHPDETQAAIVMRRAKSVSVNDSVEAAAKEMLLQNRRHLAVVDSSKKVVGILTPQNILPVVKELHGTEKVKEVLNSISVPLWENTPINVASFTMRLSRVYSCPVVNERGELLGLITDRDIFDKVNIKSSVILTETGMADDEDPWSWDGIRNVVTYVIEKSNIELPKKPIKSIMVKNPEIATTVDKISSAVAKMEKGNYNQLPVVDHQGKLVGMLYDIQIMRIFETKKAQ